MAKLNSKEISAIAMFGALAAIVTLATDLPIFSFPILPFLRFDLAEIVDFLAFLILGPIAALFTVLVHFIVISLLPGAQVPIASQAMKAASILSTILGFMAITKFKSIKFALSSAIISRVLIMSLANYLFFLVFFPFTFEPSLSLIAKTTGIVVQGFFAQVLLLLLILGIFNALHAIITTFIPVFILRYNPQIVKMASLIKPVWFVKYINLGK
jgi:riboflavin transporter FmnP